MGLDTDNDGVMDQVSPLYYDPMHISVGGTVKPGLVTVATPSSMQALEVTALAVIPPNTQKLLQYVVVPGSLNVSFPAGLTLVGNNVSYIGPNSARFLSVGLTQPWVGLALQLRFHRFPQSATQMPADNSKTRILDRNYAAAGQLCWLPPPPPAPATPSVGISDRADQHAETKFP